MVALLANEDPMIVLAGTHHADAKATVPEVKAAFDRLIDRGSSSNPSSETNLEHSTANTDELWEVRLAAGFGPPQYIVPKPFLIVEGLLGMYWQEMRNAYSVRVFLKPPEELRRRWKIRRDTTRRGYTEERVLRELKAFREPDLEAYIRPQQYSADVVVSFYPGTEQDDDAHLNVRLTLYGTLPHPDLSEVIAEDRSGCVRATLGREGGRAVEYLEIDGAIPDEPAAALERCILDHLDAHGAAPLADLGLVL